MRRFLARHTTLVVMSCLSLCAAVAVLALRGEAALWRALAGALDLAIFIVPVLGAGLLLAATMRQLLPEGALSRWLGAESGLRGLLLASVVGIVTPGGPIAAFPLVLAVLAAGAGPAQMVALISAWSVLGLHRVLVWEMPIMGRRFVLLRPAGGGLLPMLAGLLAEALLLGFPVLGR